MPRVVVVAVGLALAASAAGCAGGQPRHRAAPVIDGFGPRPPQTPAQARSIVAKSRTDWLDEISVRGRRARQRRSPLRFTSPSRSVFLARLRRASARYHFTTETVRFYRPLQLAPLVAVRSDRPRRFSRETRFIVHLLDEVDGKTPYPQRTWLYEGFFLEARDRDGVPFLFVDNYIRGKNWGGGQWARDDDWYPYAHG